MALDSVIPGNEQPVAAQPVTDAVVNAPLWMRPAVLLERPDHVYLGRVVVEVWDHFSQMMEDCGAATLNTVLFKLGLGAYDAVTQPLVTIDATPISDPSQTAGYLGRLVAEAWEDHVVVWLSGDGAVWQRALADLRQRVAANPASPQPSVNG